MRTMIIAFVFAACSSGTKTPTPPTTTGSGTTEPGGTELSHTSCTSDADCVIVETACCDHCNGGSAEAFNTAFADAHKPADCGQTACTKRGCGAAVASCDAGTCKSTVAPL